MRSLSPAAMVPVVFALLLSATAVRAQAPRPDAAARARWERTRDRLTATVARSPDDTRALCELGLAQHHLSEPAARATLDRGIAGLLAPRSRALQRRLAACLYNRGLVLEGAGDPEGARVDYARSLALRPDAAVRARMTALAPSALGTVDTTAPALPADVRAQLSPPVHAIAHATLARGPWQEAWIVSTGDPQLPRGTFVVVRRDAALSSAPLGLCAGLVSTTHALSLAPGPRGTVALYVRSECFDAGREEGDSWEQRTSQVQIVWPAAGDTILSLDAGGRFDASGFDPLPSTRVDVWPGPDGTVAIDVVRPRAEEPDERSRIVDLASP